jgi:GAF domain-containing protein
MGRFGLRARLLLAFLGISGFSILAAAAGLYAFQQVGANLGLIEQRIPIVVDSSEVSRSAERIISMAPKLIAVTTRDRRDEITAHLKPDVEALQSALNKLKQSNTTSADLAPVEQSITSFIANLTELNSLVTSRISTSDELSDLRQLLFQTDDDTQRLFAPWFHSIDTQIAHSLDNMGNSASEAAGRELAASIALIRPAQLADRDFSAVVDVLTRTMTISERPRLRVVQFQLRQSLEDLQAMATKLDPRLQPIFVTQLNSIQALAVGPKGIPALRDKELGLIDQAEKLIDENENLSASLTAAFDQLVHQAGADVLASTVTAVSVQRFSAQVLWLVAPLSLISSILIVWLYVSRDLIRRLMRLSSGMVAIADGRQQTPIAISGSDEVAEMGRVVEIFRKNTLERDELLTEKAQTAERLDQQVKERTAELALSVEELRALGEVSQAVNSTVDLETVLTTIVAKAVQLSNTEAGAIYVFDDASREFGLRATYGMDDALIAAVRERHMHVGDTAVGEAAAQRRPIQIPEVQSGSAVLDVIFHAGFRSLLAVPLLGADRIVGGLVVRRRQPGEFPMSTVDLLQTFAAQSVLAIQNARLFQEIEEKGRELAEASQHKSQFLANMSHELRTPLNAIIGVTEMLREDAEAAKQDLEPLDRVLGAGRHLLALINDILDLSKIEAGRMELQLETFLLAPLIADVVKTIEPLAERECQSGRCQMRPRDRLTAYRSDAVATGAAQSHGQCEQVYGAWNDYR